MTHSFPTRRSSDLFGQDGTSPEIFALRRYAAVQAWYENMPVRKGLFPARGGLTAHRRLDYGRLLRTHVLDTRTNRSDQVCNDGKIRPCPPDLLQSDRKSTRLNSSH